MGNNCQKCYFYIGKCKILKQPATGKKRPNCAFFKTNTEFAKDNEMAAARIANLINTEDGKNILATIIEKYTYTVEQLKKAGYYNIINEAKGGLY